MIESDWVNDLVQQVRDNILKFGWHMTGVFPTPESSLPTFFSYTTGMLDHGHPELVVFGLDPKVANQLVAAMYENYILEGHIFEDGEEIEDLANFPLRFRSAPSNHPDYPLGIGRYVYQRDDFPVLQIVLPDAKGLWPWEDNCDRSMAISQQLLMHESIAG